ncbi:DUF6350 family protein [Streptomyces diastatochromogenes]|nr:DUF6350 family protein [Streptomyces diastatochromogenes]
MSAARRGERGGGRGVVGARPPARARARPAADAAGAGAAAAVRVGRAGAGGYGRTGRGAGTAVLFGGGSLLLGVSLVLHGAAARASFLQLTEGWTGRFAVLLLGIGLIPNAAVWSASYALGPGFALGTGHLVHPLASDPAPLLPRSPARRGTGRGRRYDAELDGGTGAGGGRGDGRLVRGAGAAGRVTQEAQEAQQEPRAPWSAGRTVGVLVLAALLCAAILALLAALSGGPLGVAALARFGPLWWQSGERPRSGSRWSECR